MFAIDIETCPECSGKLRVIACIENPPLIAKILGHIRRREALIDSTPRTPPDSLPVPNLIKNGWAQAQGAIAAAYGVFGFPDSFPHPIVGQH
ncbi:MAG: hypothetical protein RQ826_12645 [Xanthomonadales bacterium]|nr:hypothetical protein [Xanthomonadales bacterium]